MNKKIKIKVPRVKMIASTGTGIILSLNVKNVQRFPEEK
jgi:hypothetical protein